MAEREPSARERWTREPGAPQRTIVDDTGRRWRVYEMALAYDRRRAPVLVFESEMAVRRVRVYPVAWHELTASELRALAETR